MYQTYAFNMAEERGFEPLRPIKTYRFSRPAPSATWVFLRMKRKKSP
jgi:hypothetical protein